MGSCCNSIHKKPKFPVNIDNEDNEIIEFEQIKNIIGSEIYKSICKIITKTKTGTGFFCNVSEKNIKLLITNNHIINEDFLNKEDKLIYSITEETEEKYKEINLKEDRYKLTNKEYDFTIIGILKEDNINNFLEINDTSYKIEDKLFSFHYAKGGKLKYSHGKIIENEVYYILHDVGSKNGSSGCPIILMNNSKVIALHKGVDKNKNGKINMGIKIEFIIDKIKIKEKQELSYIKCVYEIKDNNYIQIINNTNEKDDVNKEIESKIKILNNDKIEKLIFKKKFNKAGINKINFIIEEKLTNMSYMFQNCSSLKEISFTI